MKIWLLLFCVLILQTITAQDTVLIKTYYTGSDQKKIKEEFWVKAIDSSLKDGLYTAYFINGKRSIIGSYQDGKRNGVWVFYDLHTLQPYLKYDFDRKIELFHKNKYDQSGLEYTAFHNDSVIKLERMFYCPDYLPDSYEGFSNYINQEVRRSNIANIVENDCRIYVIIEITESGLINTSILNNSCNDEAATEVISIINSSPNWIPGKSSAKTFSIRMTKPIIIHKSKQ